MKTPLFPVLLAVICAAIATKPVPVSADEPPPPVRYMFGFDTEAQTLQVYAYDPDDPWNIPGDNENVKQCYVFTYLERPPELRAGMTLEDIEEAGAFVGYLQQAAPDADPDNPFGPSILIRRPSDERWHDAASEEGMRILQACMAPDAEGNRPRVMLPPVPAPPEEGSPEEDGETPGNGIRGH